MAVDNSGVDALYKPTGQIQAIPWQETLIALPFIVGIVVLIVSGVMMFDGWGLLKVVLGVIGLLWVMFVIVNELKSKSD